MTGRNTLGILGKKLGMSQLFLDDGTCVPVTVVQAGPCPVMQVKMVNAAEHPEGHRQASINNGKKSGKHDRARAADGYYAVQVGFDERAARLCGPWRVSSGWRCAWCCSDRLLHNSPDEDLISSRASSRSTRKEGPSSAGRSSL